MLLLMEAVKQSVQAVTGSWAKNSEHWFSNDLVPVRCQSNTCTNDAMDFDRLDTSQVQYHNQICACEDFSRIKKKNLLLNVFNSFPHQGVSFNFKCVVFKCISVIASWSIQAQYSFRPSRVNTLRPRQDGRYFTDDVLKCIFLNENVWISLKISLKFVPRVPINNIPALVLIMAWRRPGDKPLSEPMMVSLPTHICVTRPPWVNRFQAYLT